MENELIEKTIKELEEAGYKIPQWCGMHPLEHSDGVGGCWGISGGYVEKEGEAYCRNCPCYRGKNDKQK